MPDSLSSMPALMAIAVGIAACITDLHSGRIPNLLTFGAACLALVFHAAVGGPTGLLSAAGGWVVGAALFLPFFLLGGMGGGDVKLLAALGAWLGPGDAVWLAIYASLAGGGLAIAVSLFRGYLTTALRNVGLLLTYWWIAGPRPMPTLTLDHDGAPRLAFGIPMFIGTMVTVWVR